MNTKNIGLAIVAGAIIVIAGMQFRTSQAPQGKAVMTENTITPTQEQVSLKDGIYESVGKYQSPGGPEQLGVKLEIKNNAVVSADITTFPTKEKTEQFQNIFKESFSGQVIGKDIRTLKLDKVAASSLTPKGFNDAVAQIVKQAQG